MCTCIAHANVCHCYSPLATAVSDDCSWIATRLGVLQPWPALRAGYPYAVSKSFGKGVEDHCTFLLPLVVAVLRYFLVDEAFLLSPSLLHYGDVELSVCGDSGGFPYSGVALSMASSISSAVHLQPCFIQAESGV